MQASPSARVALMIIIQCQKVEIALTWMLETKLAAKRKLSAGTLVIATPIMSIQPNVIPKRVTMQLKRSARVTLTTIIIQCQRVEIAWTFLSSFQQRKPIITTVESLVTKHEKYANARHRKQLIVFAMTNVYPDVINSESEEGEAIWRFKFYSNSNWAIYMKYLSITNKLGKFI